MGKRSKGRSLRDKGGNVYGEAARHLPEAQLPTNKDVGLQMLQYEKIEGISRDDAIERTMQKVIKLYQKVSILIIAHSSIKRKIKRLIQLKREKEQASLIDKRSGKVKDQGKHFNKNKNNNFREKL